MGISAGGSSGGPKSDINVTPLVDVVLVMLIIFMVSMPLLMRHITLEIPRKLESDEVAVVSTQIQLLAKVDGTLELDDGSGTKKSIQRTELAKELRQRLDRMHSDKVVFIDFEPAMPYEQMVSIMDTIRGTGKMLEDGKREDVKVALKLDDTKALRTQ